MLINDINLTGQVAIVTGSSRGIGAAIAQELKNAHCEVIGTSSQDLDLSNDQSVEQFLLKLDRLPRIDILVNNAGINKIDDIDMIKDSDWDRIVKVNLTGCERLIKKVSAIMKVKAIQGRILNISSIFGVISKAKRHAYSASKSGLIGLTRSASLDLASHGILVNALCPGFVETELTASILSPAQMSELKGQVPLGRFANPLEIARSAVFLCSPLNSYMTGQTFIVDGGFVAR